MEMVPALSKFYRFYVSNYNITTCDTNRILGIDLLYYHFYVDDVYKKYILSSVSFILDPVIT